MERTMKKRLSAFITVLSFCATLALPIQLAAQEREEKKEQKGKHHHYKLIQMGTYGGPTSTIDGPGGPPFFPFNRIITRAGAVLGSGDTSIPDPFCFAGCFVNYAFRWRDGVQTNLGVLPQNPTIGAQTPCFDCAWSVFAFWIADNGSVAGQSLDNALDPLTGSPAPLAVLWTDSKIVNLGTFGGNQSGAGAVNDRGEVVGAALNLITDPFPFRPPYLNFFFFGNGTESHAFLWRDGTMQDLGTLGGPDSAAFLVNQKGQVAGTSDVDFNVNPVTGGPTVHPFLWEHGKMLDLVADAPPEMFGGTFGIAAWLNERGQVLGTMNLAGDTTWHSFLWDKGVVTDLGTLGGTNTTAQWLNSAGHASGKSDVTAICTACAPDNQKQLHHPFLWREGVMTDLGLLYADTAGVAYSVNANDQAVGVTVPCTIVNSNDSCDGPVYHSFLWENGSMVELQTLVLPGSGITLSCAGCGAGAYNINDHGEIAGQGVLSNGDSRVVLLIPCDENHPDVEGCDYGLVEDETAVPHTSPEVHSTSSPPVTDTAATTTLTPSSMSFSCVARLVWGGCTTAQKATLTNSGVSALGVLGINITGPYFSQTNNCPSTLKPEQSCTITVSFDGPASRTQLRKKTFSGSLSVSDTATHSPQEVLLTGTTFGVP